MNKNFTKNIHIKRFIKIAKKVKFLDINNFCAKNRIWGEKCH